MSVFRRVEIYLWLCCAACSSPSSSAANATHAPEGAAHATMPPSAASRAGAASQPRVVSPRAFASPASPGSPASQWLTTAPDVLDGRASDDASERKQAATRELLQRLAPGLSRSSEGLSWRDRGQGVRSLDLHGRFRHTMIAVRGEDGAVRTTCVDDLPSAQRVLEAADRSAP